MIINPSRYEEFVFTVKTDNPGTSNSTSFTLPLRTTGATSYNYTVEWGDGVTEAFTGTTARTHDYGIAGTYQIRITGSFVGHIFFNNTGDKAKIISVSKNALRVGTVASAFLGCTAMTSFSDFYGLEGITNLQFAWNGCTALTSFPEIDTSQATSLFGTWANCNNLTSFPLLNTSKVTTFSDAWYLCSKIISFPAIDTSSAISVSNAWRQMTLLSSFPALDLRKCTSFVSTWYQDFALVSFPLVQIRDATTFQNAWFQCTSLTTFPASFFDSWTGTPANLCFYRTWESCTALTTTSVENILVSIDTSGKSAPSGVGANDKDITINYNVATGGLTAATTTAITNLKAKNWRILINGVVQ